MHSRACAHLASPCHAGLGRGGRRHPYQERRRLTIPRAFPARSTPGRAVRTVVLDNDIELDRQWTSSPSRRSAARSTATATPSAAFSITQSVSPAGLFGVLQKDAVIKNLNVEGSVTPFRRQRKYRRQSWVKTTARLKAAPSTEVFPANAASAASWAAISPRASCARATPSGAIFGQSMTGGIVGENHGSIVSCRAGAPYVNIESTDPSIDLSNFEPRILASNLAKLSRADTLNTATRHRRYCRLFLRQRFASSTKLRRRRLSAHRLQYWRRGRPQQRTSARVQH